MMAIIIENGDTVDIDFEGFVDGKAFEGGKAEHYSLVLGSGSFIPGFEDQLIGTRTGQSIQVKVTFPTEYGAANLAGKDAVFEVKLVLSEVDMNDSGRFTPGVATWTSGVNRRSG